MVVASGDARDAEILALRHQVLVLQRQINRRQFNESDRLRHRLALARRLAEAEDLRLLLADPGPGVAFHLVFGGRKSVQRQRGGASPTSGP